MRLLLLLVLLLAGLLPQAHAELTELRRAWVTAHVDGVTREQQASLPYNWDRLHGGRPGTAVFEIPFQLDELPREPYAVYFSRVGNRAEIWLNGVLLSRLGNLDHANREDYAKAPRQVLIPAQLLQTNNQFRVIISADGGRRAGVFGVWVGPEEEVRVRYEAFNRWLVNGSIAVSVFSLLVGVVALLLWFTHTELAPGAAPRRSGLYLSAGISELCWMVRLFDTPTVDVPLPWPWWGVVQTLAYAGWFCGSAIFCHYVAGWNQHASMRWMRAVVWTFMLTAAPAAWLALTRHQDAILTGWYGLAALFFVGYAIVYFVGAARRPTTAHVLAATAGLFNVLVGARDWFVIRASSNYTEISMIRYSSVLFGLALVYIVIMRFREANAQVRDLMDNMSARVQQKEAELAASYQRLEQLAREQERAAERARILRDMHDGVGSHISLAIRQLQSGRANEEMLLQTLRDSLDQLKLSIDAMNLPPGDVTTMLANLRYRLEPRFKASGIELLWEVDLLPPLESLDGKAMRQLQFMVFEALSNVLQHAHASELRLELHAAPDGDAVLRVIDNGRGFDPERVQRKGLASLRERAAAIGVGLQVSSAPGRTVVEITLSVR